MNEPVVRQKILLRDTNKGGIVNASDNGATDVAAGAVPLLQMKQHSLSNLTPRHSVTSRISRCGNPVSPGFGGWADSPAATSVPPQGLDCSPWVPASAMPRLYSGAIALGQKG